MADPEGVNFRILNPTRSVSKSKLKATVSEVTVKEQCADVAESEVVCLTFQGSASVVTFSETTAYLSFRLIHRRLEPQSQHH